MRIKNVCFPSYARLPVALCLFVLLAGVSARTDASPSAGQERELATMYRTNGTMDATLRPGGRVVGQLAYIVPAGDRTFQLETRIGSVFNPTVDRVPHTVD